MKGIYHRIRNNTKRHMAKIPRLHKQYKPKYLYLNKSAEYYATRAWKNLRDYYIQHHPLCERCLEQGRVKPAEQVHHIVPFLNGVSKAERYQLLLDPSNLMSLCVDCHKVIHRELDKNRSLETPGVTGTPVPTGK